MEKFTALEPTRLHASASIGRRGHTASVHQKSSRNTLVGSLPADLHIFILARVAVPDIPSYSRCSRTTAFLARDDRIWEARWTSLGVEEHDLRSVLDNLEERAKEKVAALRAASPPMLPVESMDDEFGDFTSANFSSSLVHETGDLFGAFKPTSMNPSVFSRNPDSTFRSKYIRAHLLLKSITSALSSPPHLILSALTPFVSASLKQQAKMLHLLSLFLSPLVQPLTGWVTMSSSLRSAIDRFDASLLTAFDQADSQGDEGKMKDASESSWEVWGGVGDWELGKVWAEKREIFYEQGRWDPVDNVKGTELDFDAMDDFMGHILSSLFEHGSRAVRVFPPQSQVLLLFADRVAVEVVSEYITSLLLKAREVSNEIYLKATAATFRESWRMVDAVVKVAAERSDAIVSRARAEDIIYQMFEVNMDEYLDEEVEYIKASFETICRDWASKQASAAASSATSTRFLSSHSPAQTKRNVIASFVDVLKLPVTIVPRTVGAVGAALTTGGTAAASGIAMLNPQRWGGVAHSGYGNLEENGRTKGTLRNSDGWDEEPSRRAPVGSQVSSSTSVDNMRPATSMPPRHATSASNNLDLLLSLDVSLELIHASRESLKRVEIFAGYPGHYGQRVRDTIEESFVLMLQALHERHILPGFEVATNQMNAYKATDHEATASVAPLLQFFELVHVADTIQSMVQVYFDKELRSHVDHTDFLNPVMREKKRFENVLDDSVAAGLNAGTQVLMNQVEHIMLTLTRPCEYCPPEGLPLDLKPTPACVEAIQCLTLHCKLLRGSASKEVLEVFYQEVGLRLISLLHKHIKRQIISLEGGFQMIADLNAYHSFIVTLKVPSIVADFSHLKMLGHVYVVEDAKDLAQIVRDVTRYGGVYRPEDIYEFIQRRSDWKKIEKTVDKTMYSLSFKEDCLIA